LKRATAGQVNAFFRWKNISDSAERIEKSLYQMSEADVKMRFEIPSEASADVTLRRLQSFRLQAGDKFHSIFGTAQGEGNTNAQGLVTIPALEMIAETATLTVTK